MTRTNPSRVKDMTKEKTQVEKFREAAKAIEAVSDEDYDEAVSKVAKARKLTDDQIKELAKQLRKQKR